MKKASDLQLKHLESKHQQLDTHVEQLMQRQHLTPTEYDEAVELKKRKLLVKDDIEALRQDLAR